MLVSTVHSSSPFSSSCSTPSRSSYYSARSHQPLTSSPLASPTYSSPTHAVQERRRAQYKSIIFGSRNRTPTGQPFFSRAGNQTTPEDPQRVFLRERLQARCREAQKLRDLVVSSRRKNSERYSDVFMDGDDDDDESDDVIMQDELFRRIMQNSNHKRNHAYRVSYAFEVGSSFDPNLEDATVWETELREQSSSGTEPTPEDLDEEELLEYAALADFADLDLTADDLAALSDIEDMPRAQPSQTSSDPGEMDVS